MRATTPIVLMAAGMLALLLALVGSLYGGSYVLSSLSDCSGKERDIVERYPHFGDRRIATYPWTFSCSVRYTTKASRKEVLVYYDALLDRHSWEIVGFQTMYVPKGMRDSQAKGKRLSDLSELPPSAGGALGASRDGYGYWVYYEPPNREDPDLPNDKAMVMVSASDHPTRASYFTK
jgi:hypothetical protein